MALWQTGVQWAPPLEFLQHDENGALEHVAKHFGQWTQKVAKAVMRHKNNEKTQEAIRNSGSSFGKHGLTAEEERNRQERKNARANFFGP